MMQRCRGGLAGFSALPFAPESVRNRPFGVFAYGLRFAAGVPFRP